MKKEKYKKGDMIYDWKKCLLYLWDGKKKVLLNPEMKEKKKELKFYWCESCGTDDYGHKDTRWSSYDVPKWCPRCRSDQIRRTMTPEEAEMRGLKKKD